MKCDPKVCSPEPMLRKMIMAAATRRRWSWSVVNSVCVLNPLPAGENVCFFSVYKHYISHVVVMKAINPSPALHGLYGKCMNSLQSTVWMAIQHANRHFQINIMGAKMTGQKEEERMCEVLCTDRAFSPFPQSFCLPVYHFSDIKRAFALDARRWLTDDLISVILMNLEILHCTISTNCAVCNKLCDFLQAKFDMCHRLMHSQ